MAKVMLLSASGTNGSGHSVPSTARARRGNHSRHRLRYPIPHSLPRNNQHTLPQWHPRRLAVQFPEAEIRQVLIEFVVEQTGYPEEIIELDADLEGDLGIDSIKKAQLFGEVGAHFSIAPRDDLSLDDFPTLGHVLNFLTAEVGGSASPAPVAPAVPAPEVPCDPSSTTHSAQH